jgi:hypothetical protein
MQVDTITICFVIFPFTFVNVAIGMPKLTATICFVLSPLTFVASIVRPDLNAWSMTHFVK